MKAKHTLPLFVFLLFSFLLIQSCSNECENVVCLNGGVCIEGICSCPDGFSGTNCETEDLCITSGILCQNNGNCSNGLCDCPDGFTGDHCEFFDSLFVQDLLDSGKTPQQLVDGGIPIESLYGTIYLEGLIFYYDETSGAGLLSAMTDQSENAEWGCATIDIEDLNNVSFVISGEPSGEGSEIGDGVENTNIILQQQCVAINVGSDLAANSCRALGSSWFLPSLKELDLMYNNLHVNGFGNFSERGYWNSTEDDLEFAWIKKFDTGVKTSSFKNMRLNVRAAKAF